MSRYAQYTYDAELSLKPAGIVTNNITPLNTLDIGNGFVEADTVIDLNAIDAGMYMIQLVGSNDPTMTTGVAVLATKTFTATASSISSVPGVIARSTAGRYVIPFTNEENNTLYRYVRLFVTLSGVTTGINFSAFIGKDD